MKKIPLTRGKVALVDDEDYDFLNQWKWHAGVNGKSDNFYARRAGHLSENYCSCCKNLLPGSKPITFLMHRELISVGEDEVVDHIDRNSLNNQKHNLRVCSVWENSMNRTARKNCSSKYLGVSKMNYINRDKKTRIITSQGIYWKAQIRYKGELIGLGTFPYTNEGEIAAAKAYDNAATIYFKNFANLNFKH